MSSLRLNFFDTYTGVALHAAGVLTPIIIVPSGEGDQTRLGSSLQLIKVDLNTVYDVPDQAVSSPAGNSFRTMLVYDCQPNGGTPSIADTILQTYSGAIPAYYAHPNFDNDNRFIILSDRVVNVNPAGITGTHNIQAVVGEKISIDCCHVPRTIFQAGTTNIQTGQLYFIVIPIYDRAGTPNSDIFFNARVWYKFL